MASGGRGSSGARASRLVRGRVARRGVRRRSRGRHLCFDRGQLGGLRLVAPGRLFGILDIVQDGYLHRGAIGGRRVGPILLGVEDARDIQNDLKLARRQVGALRIVDQTAPGSRCGSIGVDLSQTGGMVAEQPRRVGEFFLRPWRPETPKRQRPFCVEELLIISQRILRPVQLLQDIGDEIVVWGQIVYPLKIARLGFGKLLVKRDASLKFR